MRKRLFSAGILLAFSLLLAAPAFAAEGEAHALSSEGLAFIRQYDSFRPEAYQIGGTWYIGYHTPCEEGQYPEGISEEEAQLLLETALLSCEAAVRDFLDRHKLTLEQHQFDAMVSFTYARGSSWTDTNDRMTKYLVAGIDSIAPVELVDAMAVWCRVESQVDDGQLQRRIDEARLLLHGDYGNGDAPQYGALILDAAGGTMESDTVCYRIGESYGSLPAATRSAYRLEGWFLENGALLSADATVSGNLRVTAKWAPLSALSFLDVMESDWFFPYVYDLYRGGVINGHSATQFAPEEDVTLAQALKLVLLAAGHKAQAPTGSHWASGYLDYAIAKSLLPTGTHRLDQPISRLEIARLAAKALTLPASTTVSPFADSSDGAVLSLYDARVIEGSYEGSRLVFLPESNITRAEISAIIWRMAELDKGGSVTPTEPDRSNQILYRSQWLDILPTVPKNVYKASNFYTSNGRTLYRDDTYTVKTGVDVSVYQNIIDWEKVKADGIDFAIIRVGGRGWGQEGNIYEDRNFKQNIEGALNAGLEVGVYFFSQAITAAEARAEASYTLNAIKGYDITYPVVFDWERIGGREARTYNIATSNLCAAANAFCSMVEDAGYEAMIYFNCDCGYLAYDLSKIVDYRFWFAQYEVATPTFYYHYDIWQYTSSGTVNGIPGRVDLNIEFIKR